MIPEFGEADFDEDGNLVVSIADDAEVRTYFEVYVTDANDEQIGWVSVYIGLPIYGDSEYAHVEPVELEVSPGQELVIPNDGAKMPTTGTVKVEGPGTATLGDNDEPIVEVADDAEIGSTIEVEVWARPNVDLLASFKMTVIDEVIDPDDEDEPGGDDDAPGGDEPVGDDDDQPGDGDDDAGSDAGSDDDAGSDKDGSDKPAGDAEADSDDEASSEEEPGSEDGAGEEQPVEKAAASTDQGGQLASTGAGVLGALGLGGLLAAAGGLLARRRK
ncbi:hypothetical protein [Auritidibacter ignavus]|uniref:hypothetical protein n=1 Tax=Auritidibacter ignavus TaxID=678932 RepID=UPI00244BA6B5|nr:hypothetical protein [Auritidibacter ignavus]WGH82963.1 hypothetical protein QDX20_06610 [Auritidibacter ignavus]